MVSNIQLYRAFTVKNTKSPVIATHDVGMKSFPLPVECKKKPKINVKRYLKSILWWKNVKEHNIKYCNYHKTQWIKQRTATTV